MITNRKDDICVLFLSLHVPVEGAARDEKIMHGNGNVVPSESFSIIQSSIVCKYIIIFGIICVVKT
jgi:hypothetical protein